MIFIVISTIFICCWGNIGCAFTEAGKVRLMDYDVEIFDALMSGAQGSEENQKRTDVLISLSPGFRRCAPTSRPPAAGYANRK